MNPKNEDRNIKAGANKKAPANSNRSAKTIEVYFQKSPTGSHGLAYSQGKREFIDSKLALKLIREGVAIAATDYDKAQAAKK